MSYADYRYNLNSRDSSFSLNTQPAYDSGNQYGSSSLNRQYSSNPGPGPVSYTSSVTSNYDYSYPPSDQYSQHPTGGSLSSGGFQTYNPSPSVYTDPNRAPLRVAPSVNSSQFDSTRSYSDGTGLYDVGQPKPDVAPFRQPMSTGPAFESTYSYPSDDYRGTSAPSSSKYTSSYDPNPSEYEAVPSYENSSWNSGSDQYLNTYDTNYSEQRAPVGYPSESPGVPYNHSAGYDQGYVSPDSGLNQSYSGYSKPGPVRGVNQGYDKGSSLYVDSEIGSSMEFGGYSGPPSLLRKNTYRENNQYGSDRGGVSGHQSVFRLGATYDGQREGTGLKMGASQGGREWHQGGYGRPAGGDRGYGAPSQGGWSDKVAGKVAGYNDSQRDRTAFRASQNRGRGKDDFRSGMRNQYGNHERFSSANAAEPAFSTYLSMSMKSNRGGNAYSPRGSYNKGGFDARSRINQLKDKTKVNNTPGTFTHASPSKFKGQISSSKGTFKAPSRPQDRLLNEIEEKEKAEMELQKKKTPAELKEEEEARLKAEEEAKRLAKEAQEKAAEEMRKKAGEEAVKAAPPPKPPQTPEEVAREEEIQRKIRESVVIIEPGQELSVLSEDPTKDMEMSKELRALLKTLTTDYLCRLCSVRIVGPQMASMHYNGKNHLKKLRNFVQTNGRSAGLNLGTSTEEEKDEGSSTVEGEKTEVVEITEVDEKKYCKSCKLSFSQDSQAEMHYKGKNHAKKLRNMGRPEVFACKICCVTVTAQEHLTAHLNGARHKLQIRKMDTNDAHRGGLRGRGRGGAVSFRGRGRGGDGANKTGRGAPRGRGQGRGFKRPAEHYTGSAQGDQGFGGAPYYKRPRY